MLLDGIICIQKDYQLAILTIYTQFFKFTNINVSSENYWTSFYLKPRKKALWKIASEICDYKNARHNYKSYKQLRKLVLRNWKLFRGFLTCQVFPIQGYSLLLSRRLDNSGFSWEKRMNLVAKMTMTVIIHGTYTNFAWSSMNLKCLFLYHNCFFGVLCKIYLCTPCLLETRRVYTFLKYLRPIFIKPFFPPEVI